MVLNNKIFRVLETVRLIFEIYNLQTLEVIDLISRVLSVKVNGIMN